MVYNSNERLSPHFKLRELERSQIAERYEIDKEIKAGKIVRLHVPLRTNQHVHFYLWEGRKQNHYNLDVGKYYYVDVSKPHAVQNKAIFDRLHLVVDCYNNPRLENLLKQGDELEGDICSPIGF